MKNYLHSEESVTKEKSELLRDKELFTHPDTHRGEYPMHAEMSIDPLKSSNYVFMLCVMKRVNANDPTGCKTLQ